MHHGVKGTLLGVINKDESIGNKSKSSTKMDLDSIHKINSEILCKNKYAAVSNIEVISNAL